VVEQEAATQGIIMFKGVELIFVIRQENIVLPIVEPTITKGVPMAIRIKYSEPRLNQ
jgi:hypothetical protein